jgi:hypothetical protein
MSLANLYNLLSERYSNFHQPTFELTMMSMCAGNISAVIVIGYYINRVIRVTKPKNNDKNKNFIDCEHIHSDIKPTYLEENNILLKTQNTNVHRKQVHTKVYITDILPVINTIPNKKLFGRSLSLGNSHKYY